MEMTESKSSNSKVQFAKETERNMNSIMSPLTKKWFREQFGLGKDKQPLADCEKPQALDTAAIRLRRRSSSLPDLSAMLDAASRKKHGTLPSFPRGPARVASIENITKLKGKGKDLTENEQKRCSDEVGQEKTLENETKVGLIQKVRRRSRSVPDLSDLLDSETRSKHFPSNSCSPRPAGMLRKKAVLSPWIIQAS